MTSAYGTCLCPAVAWVLIAMCPTPAPAAGDPSSPVGEWRTIDDTTGTPQAVVRIYERDGELIGVVERALIKNPPHTSCDACTDDRRGKPILGMELIRGMHKDGDKWDGGTILDPNVGKVYRCTLSLRDGGERLAVRGYIGISLLGRTQIWERMD